MAASTISWQSIPCEKSEVCLNRTLVSGQCFRWRMTGTDEWTGVFAGRVWTLKQTDTQLFYKVRGRLEHQTCAGCLHNKTMETTGDEMTVAGVDRSVEAVDLRDRQCLTDCDDKVLRDYLQLHVNLKDLYNTWDKADGHFDKISCQFPGIRVLRQEPVECLFSFICSSNNNITRITSMVENLASHYGDTIMEIDGIKYNTFPCVAALSADGVEATLRQLGFGYRAKYLQRSAELIEQNGGESWLYSLRNIKYKKAKTELMKLYGVGAKVADCVCLFSLDQTGCVPVDTHVWQIAARDYMPDLRTAKSLTDRLYQDIADHFRELWGPYAGWAHSVLFAADLKQFKENSKKSAARATVKEVGKPVAKRAAKKDKTGSTCKKRMC